MESVFSFLDIQLYHKTWDEDLGTSGTHQTLGDLGPPSLFSEVEEVGLGERLGQHLLATGALMHHPLRSSEKDAQRKDGRWQVSE